MGFYQPRHGKGYMPSYIYLVAASVAQFFNKEEEDITFPGIS